MRVSNSSRYGLPLVAALVLTAALSLWIARRNRPEISRAEQDRQVHSLLQNTVKADNTLTYSAISTVTAMYGDHKVKARARLVRAPRKLSITYMDGDSKGLHSGYNEKWFWRQDSDNSPLRAYAEVEYRPYQMAEKRFELTTKNYRGRLLGSETLNGRLAQIVELQRSQLIDGAPGPMKRLWIDQESGLTLRVDSFNYQARKVMTSELSNIDLDPDVKDAFVPPAQMKTAATMLPWMASELGDQIQKVVQITRIYPPQLDYVPPGFEFDSVGVHRCNDTGAKYVAALTRYSDGINVLTVFAMRPDAKLPGTSGSVNGSASANAKGSGTKDNSKRQSCDFGMGTMVMRKLPAGRLIAVADLPPQTLNRVLDSTRIRFAPPGNVASSGAPSNGAASNGAPSNSSHR
ncbi:MAG TPA: sigma-E factor regulatory protein RseB domain-containing protein [Abditibacteriaceae bacterium]|jgi:negative regulator of sigma E activity